MLQAFRGAKSRRTQVYVHYQSDCHPVETEAEGFVGVRSEYDEPTTSFVIHATGVPADLMGELVAVVRKIRAIATE